MKTLVLLVLAFATTISATSEYTSKITDKNEHQIVV